MNANQDGHGSEQTQGGKMSKLKVTPNLVIGLLLVCFIGLSVIIRVVPPFHSIFTDSWVKYSSIDAYHTMRLVDNLAHNFPHMTQMDLYYIFPDGPVISSSGTLNFFTWLLSFVIWIIGLGSPSHHLVDVVSVFFPVVLAALTVIPVFFIGKALFNKWVGLIAAFLIAVFPGEYLGRSILGFTDIHVAEVLFSSLALILLFCIVVFFVFHIKSKSTK